MAKLNVTIPANEIVIEGETYRRVDRNAALGDVVKITDEEAREVGVLTFDAFYRVERVDRADDPHVLDNDGDDYDLCGWDYEVYEKVTEPEPTVPRRLTTGDYGKVVSNGVGHNYKIGSVVKIVSAQDDYVGEKADGTRGNYLNERNVVPATEVEFLAQRVSVLRLKIGDYAKVVNVSGIGGNPPRSDVNIGDIVEITGGDFFPVQFQGNVIGGDKGLWFMAERLVPATEAEVAEAKRKIAQASDPRSQFVKGDKVRLVSGGGRLPLNGYKDGEVYEVIDPGTSTNGGKYVRIIGGSVNSGYALPSEIVKLSAEEIESLDRIPVGSYVKVLVDTEDLPEGAIGKVERDDRDDRPYRVELLDGRDWDYYRKDQLEVLTQADAEKAEAQAAEAAKWYAIGRKVNEYKIGDIVRFVRDGFGNGLRDHINIITEIDKVNESSLPYHLVKPAFVTNPNNTWAAATVIELVTPVESRFDRSEPKGGVA
ncbi:hypothetical protein ACFOQM_23545 [Paenibacillus sp. GCM10012307]|uniref:Uncharacterized protein n=1 Tax=Paenibacillus roseus TaxID=2798579 RepID=A0A934JCC4_9BACL|nr:hypothetical protein [Paenibacillus roseus]MBJ6364198.1 hypothetical protein [Paenibacillus roseus]